MNRAGLALASAVVACGAPQSPTTGAQGSADVSAPIVIDRFSRSAGHLMVRTASNHLPEPGAPIDLGQPPFITQAFGPDGGIVRYNNFDIQSPTPAPLYRVMHGDEHISDIVDVIPGVPGYSDFFQIVIVDAPAGAHPTRADDLAGWPRKPQLHAIDCPIVPPGTTQADDGAPATPIALVYRGTQVTCLQFGATLTLEGGKVPTSPIYVTFNAPSGPASGFRTESPAHRPRAQTPPQQRPLAQTHNVVFSVPGDVDYSPLWDVHIYDRSAFERVRDAESALQAPLVEHGPLVNCPVVFVAPR